MRRQAIFIIMLAMLVAMRFQLESACSYCWPY